jgi:hypothetical protein
MFRFSKGGVNAAEVFTSAAAAAEGELATCVCCKSRLRLKLYRTAPYRLLGHVSRLHGPARSRLHIAMSLRAEEYLLRARARLDVRRHEPLLQVPHDGDGAPCAKC